MHRINRTSFFYRKHNKYKKKSLRTLRRNYFSEKNLNSRPSCFENEVVTTPSKSSNIPLVFLSGTGCNELLWQKILPFIPNSMKPIIIPDLLSCTSKEEMLNMIHEQPYDRFVLLGFSMGGYLAQEFYSKYPDRVSHMVLICCSGEGYDNNRKKLVNNLIKKIEGGKLNPISLKHISQFIYEGSDNFEDAHNTLKNMLEVAGISRICRQMKITLNRDSYYDAFKKHSVPILIIGSRYDKVVPLVHTEKLAQAFATEVNWINCGHMAPLESPNDVGFILNQWFTLQKGTQKELSLKPQEGIEEELMPAGNQKGFFLQNIDPYTKKFIDNLIHDDSYDKNVPILEIGAGQGIPTQILLRHGFKVIVNDTSAFHLSQLWNNVPLESRAQLLLLWGNITDYKKLNIRVNGVIANRILHFLNGEELETLFEQLNRWLPSNRKIVATVASPSMRLFNGTKELYEMQVKSKMLYPGWIKVHSFIGSKYHHHLPLYMHLFKEKELNNLFQENGYQPECIGGYECSEEPPDFLGESFEESPRIGIIARR